MCPSGGVLLGSKFIREALIEQNKNPLFSKSPSKTLPDGKEILLTPHAKPNPEVVLPEGLDPTEVPRVRYSFDDLMALSESSLVKGFVTLPESLQFLDKRVDLEVSPLICTGVITVEGQVIPCVSLCLRNKCFQIL